MRAGGAGPSATKSNVLKALLLPHRLLQITGNQALANRPVEVAAFLFHYFHTPILSPLQHLKNGNILRIAEIVVECPYLWRNVTIFAKELN